jgi:hypothetical protein
MTCRRWIFTVVTVAALSLPATAGAYHYRSTGSPGSMVTPRAWGYVKTSYGPITGNIFDPSTMASLDDATYAVGFTSRYVGRSPADAGAQTVTVYTFIRYKHLCSTPPNLLESCTPGTVPYKTFKATIPIAAGVAGGRAGIWSTPVAPNYGPYGALVAVHTNVTWRTQAGVFLGRKQQFYDQTGDYGCLTVRCSISYSRDAGRFLFLHGA